MNREISILRLSAAFALVVMTAQARTIISEKFAGSAETDLVGQATTCGNTWTGATRQGCLNG